MAATQFQESGSNATGDCSFWVDGAGGNGTTSSTTVGFSGPRSIKFPNNGSGCIKNNVMADAGRRLTFRSQIDAAPTGTAPGTPRAAIVNGSGSRILALVITPAKKLALYTGASTLLTTGTTVLSVNTTYRVSLSYTISSTTVNQFRVYLNGVQELTQSNVTLSGTGGLHLQFFGETGGSANFYIGDIYVDNGTDLADPGNIRVTRKAPFANNTNNFDTAIGANPANRWTNVNEVPINETNGWKQAGLSSVQENYTLETPGQGDVNINTATYIARTAWIWAKHGPTTTISRTQAVSADADHVAITTPTAGDAIVVFSYRNNNTTAPTLAAGYTSVDTQGPGGSSNSARLAWKISDGTETTSGTWTNATNVVCEVYSGVNSTPVGGFTATVGSSATLTYGTVAMQVGDGTSWVAAMGGAKGASAGMGGNPTGLTNHTNTTTINGLSTNAAVSSFSAATLAVTGSGRWITYTVEIVADARAGTPKIMDNGTETAITLGALSAIFTVLTDSASYPSNAAGIGMRSNGVGPDTILYDCGTIISYIPGTPGTAVIPNAQILLGVGPT